MILVDHGDGSVAQFRLHTGRNRVDRKCKGEENQKQQDWIAPKAIQLLYAQAKNILQSLAHQASCFFRKNVASIQKMTQKAASQR